jgi:membrane protease YdiL (CAAX protease family)
MASKTPSRPRTWLRDHPLATFFAIAFGITWAVWVPRALDSRGVIDAPWAVELGAVWSWMPAVAALLAAVLVGGRPGLREWASRLVRWRVGWRWYLLALLGPAAFWVALGSVAAVLGLGTDMQPRVLDLGAAAVLVFAALLLTDGLGEEPGWRGYALPRWLARNGALTASVGLGAVWAVWHLPLVFTAGSTLDGSPIAFLLLDFTAMAVLYTWLFLRSRGSVLPVIVLHASANLWTPVAVLAGTFGQLATVVVAKWLLVAVVVWIGLTPKSPHPPIGAGGRDRRMLLSRYRSAMSCTPGVGRRVRG